MRLGSKQIMNADAFHEPTWISDGQPGVIHQHTHAAKNGVVPVSKRIDQGFPERPLIEFRHHRRKQSYIQFRPRIPWFKRFRNLFYGFEQRSTICLVHPDIGAYKHLKTASFVGTRRRSDSSLPISSKPVKVGVIPPFTDTVSRKDFSRSSSSSSRRLRSLDWYDAIILRRRSRSNGSKSSRLEPGTGCAE